MCNENSADFSLLVGVPLKELSFEALYKRIESTGVDFDETMEENDCWIISQDSAVSLLKESIAQYYIIQHLSQLPKTVTINPSRIFFSSFLSSVNHVMEDTSDSSDQQLKDVLSQWKFEQVPESDGNCLFTAVSLSLLQHHDQTVFNTIGIDQNFDALLISQILRKLVVQEWLGENSEYYQKFVTFDIRDRAEQYLNSGEFAGDLGDLIVVTLANILHLPIAVFTNIPNLSILCIVPQFGVTSTKPLFLTYNCNGPGHYDCAMQISYTMVSDKPHIHSTKCYCGRKKECSGTPCSTDMHGNYRCPCAKRCTPCTSTCRCKNCCNHYGIKAPASTRKRDTYSTQKQPLSGKKGTEFMKMVGEYTSTGQASMFEHLLTAVVIHFLVNGIEVTPESQAKAYSCIKLLADTFTFVDFLLFKRSVLFFSR